MDLTKKGKGADTIEMKAFNTSDALRRAILENLRSDQGKFPAVASKIDYYLSLARAIRDRLMRRWTSTARTYHEQNSRTVVYLSAEYLLGPQLENNLINLDIYREAESTLIALGIHLDDLLDQEPEPGLGNGGLGRLAACYMDSLATLQIPAIGYGIRYEFGIFSQAIREGWQVEMTDKWLRYGNPWEIAQAEICYNVCLGGHTVHHSGETGRDRVQWVPDRMVTGVAHDTPVLGYKVNTANILRLWKAEAAESFDFHAFNVGDYYRAVEQKVSSENITKVLYPNDEPAAGKQLRLEQQYFFVSCSLQDMIRIYLQKEKTFDHFHEKYAVQLNDTHPALAVAELMRLLVDVHGLDWDRAWQITTNTMAYTNHTLLPEALETYSIPLFARLLPRHLEIIYEINGRFLHYVKQRFPDDDEKLARLSLIGEFGEKQVRMANLACVGGHAINGVAKLHSELLKQTVLKDFYDLWPQKFSNKTNGVTPRRFMALSNPKLTELISTALDDNTWISNLEKLRQLEPLAGDTGFRSRWARVKYDCKRRLAERIKWSTGLEVDPASLFDIQTKRMHEYKRQLLNLLHIITLYNRLKSGSDRPVTPRTCIFGGKAAPGYFMAKLIIKLINSVAETINNDPAANKILKVVFFPDFNVKNAQIIYPAADLSEQISTAGYEASGTGNMKFSMNGALTIGTMDGANIEIREAVGPENFFAFGLTVDEIAKMRGQGYRPRDIYEKNEELHQAIDLIWSGAFSPGDRQLFQPVVNGLLNRDDFMLLADYPLYLDCQKRVEETWQKQSDWQRMSILNVARMGTFSSDRAIQEYCNEVWHVKPVSVELDIIKSD
jgi:glycogen phosphorylase